MKAYHICYHTDEDGLASAAVIYEYLKIVNKKHKNSVRYFFYKVDYTMDLRTVITDIPSGDEIYFVDYSFSNEDNLKYILELSNKDITVTWIDHHKTSKDFIEDPYNKYSYLTRYPNFNYFINTNYCGAYLAYIYAYLKVNNIMDVYDINLVDLIVWPSYIPLYIKYVDSWDTWKHNMPNTTEFSTGVRSENRTPSSLFSSIFKYKNTVINKLFSCNPIDQEMLEVYMEEYIESAITKGKVIKEYQDIEYESVCENYGFEFCIVDDTRIYRCFAVNSRGNSTIFGDRVNKYDIVVPFRFNGDKYIYSLYTSKDYVNCEELAKKLGSMDGLGGGGHAKAAGFQTYNQIIRSECAVYITSKLFRKNKYNVFTV